MKPFKRILIFSITAMLFVACSPKVAAAPLVLQVQNPYAPQAGDKDLMRGEIKIDSASVDLSETKPVQATLNFAYFPPTPCYQLRVEVSQPDAQNRIDVSAYGVAEKDKPCTLMALATPQQASLDLGSLPQGHYSLWLNGKPVSEFDA